MSNKTSAEAIRSAVNLFFPQMLLSSLHRFVSVVTEMPKKETAGADHIAAHWSAFRKFQAQDKTLRIGTPFHPSRALAAAQEALERRLPEWIPRQGEHKLSHGAFVLLSGFFDTLDAADETSDGVLDVKRIDAAFASHTRSSLQRRFERYLQKSAHALDTFIARADLAGDEGITLAAAIERRLQLREWSLNEAPR